MLRSGGDRRQRLAGVEHVAIADIEGDVQRGREKERVRQQQCNHEQLSRWQRDDDGHHDRDRVNRAHALQAEFLCKPPEAESVASFARRAIAYHWTRSRRVASILDAMASERQLTPRESELIAAAIAGMPRRLVAEELGVSENTVKVQIRLLLVKCGVSNLD